MFYTFQMTTFFQSLRYIFQEDISLGHMRLESHTNTDGRKLTWSIKQD